jgi:Fic family protein
MRQMDLKDFIAGTYSRQYQYKSFSPTPINHAWIWSDPRLNTLLSEANLKLSELNAFSLHVPDVDFFIAMHVVKEATTSSKIEGTQTAVGDAVLKKAEIEPEARDDWQEVQNYIKAMNHAVRRLKDLPLSTRLLKETHRLLLGTGRGKQKLPGEFRKSQNWIGGHSLRDAAFVPPHHDEVDRLLQDLEDFLHNTEIDVPDLVRIAIVHYQFETIHPFLDGNGRIGRLIITLFLLSRGLLTKPTFYLSEYLERHRSRYIEKLERARTSNDLAGWVSFFLIAVRETSQKGIETLGRILKLKKDIEEKRIITMGKKTPKARELMKLLYRQPSVSAADVAKGLRVTPATANSLIRDFVEQDILIEVTGHRRNRLFSFREYIDLFQ